MYVVDQLELAVPPKLHAVCTATAACAGRPWATRHSRKRSRCRHASEGGPRRWGTQPVPRRVFRVESALRRIGIEETLIIIIGIGSGKPPVPIRQPLRRQPHRFGGACQLGVRHPDWGFRRKLPAGVRQFEKHSPRAGCGGPESRGRRAAPRSTHPTARIPASQPRPGGQRCSARRFRHPISRTHPARKPHGHTARARRIVHSPEPFRLAGEATREKR